MRFGIGEREKEEEGVGYELRLICTLLQFNVAEAVNFALSDWIPYGLCCLERYRHFRRTPVFSHELLMCRIANDLAEEEDAAWYRSASFL